MKKKLSNLIVSGFLLSALLCGCASLSVCKSSSDTSSPEQYSGIAAYHYSMAVLLRLDGDLGGSIDHLKEAVAVQPESSYFITELVSVYVENNNIDMALSLGEAALVRNPHNTDMRSILGGLYFNLREYEKAIREYQTIIELEPKNQVAYLYLATIYAQEKKYDSAESAYKKMLELDPENIIGIYYYAKTLTAMNRLAEATVLYQKIIGQRPAFDAAWLELAALYETQKKYNEAIGLYRRYLEMNPARISFRVKIAELLIKVDKNEEAEIEFQEVLKSDSDNQEVKIALALLYYEMKKYDLAITQFSTLLEKKPDDDKVRYLLANALEQKGDAQAARAHYQNIASTFELYSNAQIHAAMILKKEGKTTEAVSVMTQAIQKKNDQAVLYLYLSSLYEDAKDLAAAEKTVREGIGKFPRNTDLHYILGTILDKANRYDEGVLAMEKVLEIDPQNADALNFIGYSYADRGIHLEQAEQLITLALKIKPDNGYILDSLGWLHFKQKKYESALNHLKRALELLPKDSNIMEHLGDLYLKTGQDKEALDFYRKALKIDSENSALKKKLDDLIKKK